MVGRSIWWIVSVLLLVVTSRADFVTYEQFSRENRVHNHNTLPANILKAKQNCPGGSMQLFPGVCKPIFKLNPECK
ncbi:hypothetical protein YQE_06266, partial [Dendroctonus ponderosae]